VTYLRAATMQRETPRKEQLDGLRAFAILPVLYAHFWNEDTWLGSAGVFLFFVLSGYLITGILLRSRTKPSALRNFYLRRALRIAPIYYVTLGLAWLIHLPGFRQTFLWHFFYLSNVLFTLKNSWTSPWYTAHLWTLSVEEQFYLVWPFLILFLPFKAIKPVVWSTIIASIVYQLGAYWFFGVNALGPAILVFSSLDKLGLGALLALEEARLGFPRFLTKAGWVAFVIFLGLEALPINHSLAWAFVLRAELLTVIFAALIAAASSGIPGPAGAILNSRIVQYVGRISYGIYLFHLFLWEVTSVVLARLSLPPLGPGPRCFIVMSAMSIGAAAVSWHFFEQPINRLKERLYVFPPMRVLPIKDISKNAPEPEGG
jgi:peptidoglycan/LPS O-acetylase OafA/YrhL